MPGRRLAIRWLIAIRPLLSHDLTTGKPQCEQGHRGKNEQNGK